ncbi:MAG: hypothetical protein OXH97_09480 [Chloroflexota bacterium]|nr:hypothetical protein [Chloroflexota bacterium]
MTSLGPDGIHILAADGTVLRANLKDRKAGRSLARRLSSAGESVVLADSGTDYRRLYTDGYQDGRRPPSPLSGENHRTPAPAEHLVDDDRMQPSDIVEALGDRRRAVPASAFDASSPAASQCGVYAWWADETARRLIAETLRTEVAPLIYIGQTKQTLARRIRAHLRVKIGKSTFRKSLTAIRMTEPAVAARHPDPDASAWLDELSNWMREHLEVAILAVDYGELDTAERAALSRYDPPLNLQDVGRTPSRGRLTELRRQLEHA